MTMMAMTSPCLEAADWSGGKVFPPIVLPTIDGEQSLSLNDFRGEKVMLHVFASW